MTTTLADVKCTCGSPSMWARNHDATKCDLWTDDDFAHETAYWSVHKGHLIEAPIDWKPLEEEHKPRPALETEDQFEDASVVFFSKEEERNIDFENDPKWEKLPSGGWRYLGEAGLKKKKEQEATQQELEGIRRDILMAMDPDKMTDEEWWELEHILQREQGLIIDSLKTKDKELVCPCQPSHTWICKAIGASRESLSDPWKPMSDKQRALYGLTPTKTGSTFGGTTTYKGKYGGSSDWDDEWETGSTYTYVKCRHYGQEVVFPNGTVVLASSSHKRKEGEEKPTMGLYAASSWNPSWAHMMIPWTDYDLPQEDFYTAAWCIETMFNLATDGDVIEVGCVGGHGRTGTILACMAVLSGVKGAKAVEWVKANYCDHAVESKRQEWFVRWFDSTRRGVKPPKMPDKHIFGGTTTTGVNKVGDCSEADHWRRIEEGWTKCWKKECQWWEVDAKKYVEKFGSMPDPASLKIPIKHHTRKLHEDMFKEGNDTCPNCQHWEQDTKGLTRPKAPQPRQPSGRKRRRNRRRRGRRQHRRELMRTGTRNHGR